MQTLETHQIAYELHESTGRLSFLLDTLLAPASARQATAAKPATPQQMSALLSELMRAGMWLRSMPAEKSAALQHELAEYRRQVERLRELLPGIHAALLGERARLEQERERVRAAAEWAQASGQTL